VNLGKLTKQGLQVLRLFLGMSSFWILFLFTRKVSESKEKIQRIFEEDLKVF